MKELYLSPTEGQTCLFVLAFFVWGVGMQFVGGNL